MDKRGLSSSSRFWGAEGLSRGCSHILAGATLLHTWLGLEDCLPWWPTPAADIPVPVVGRRPHFLYIRASPHEFPHEMASDFPHRERTKRARWKVQDLVWSSLWRHTPTHTQTFWWSRRQSRFNKGRATQRHGSQEVSVVEGHFGWWLWDSNSHEEEKSLSHSLILVWNLLWPIETGGNDAVRVLRQATRFPFAAPTLLECSCHVSSLDSPPWGWENRKREGLVPDIPAEASDTRGSPASSTFSKDRLFLLSPTQMPNERAVNKYSCFKTLKLWNGLLCNHRKLIQYGKQQSVFCCF